MGSNRINLLVRFLLELAALIAMGMWGWRLADGSGRYVLAVGIPLLMAMMWGIFAVPGDPSRSGKAPVPVRGLVRLIFELAFFGFATWGLINMGFSVTGWSLAFILVAHYVISYDRIQWLLKR